VHNKSAADQGSPIGTIRFFRMTVFLLYYARSPSYANAVLDLFASAQQDIARESSFLFSTFFIDRLYRRRFELRSAALPAIRLTRGIPRVHNYIPHPLTDTK